MTSDIPLRFGDKVIERSRRLSPDCVDYSIFNITKESYYSSLLPRYVRQVTKIITLHFGGVENINYVIDANANVGCDTINFSKNLGAECISLEVDKKTYDCLVKNQEAFSNLESNEVIINNFSVHCNCLDFLKGFKKYMDFVYFDPPWGGINYTKKINHMLYLTHNGNKIPIYKVIKSVLNEGFTNTAILKIPYNFNMRLFRQRLGRKIICKLYPVYRTSINRSVAFYITICNNL